MIDWGEIQHFDAHEFRCPCCDYNRPDEGLIRLLCVARETCGVPFVITSGCRCLTRNQLVGGKTASSHLPIKDGSYDGKEGTSKAVDIHVPDSYTRFQILDALLIAGFKRIGVGNTFIHADVDSSKPQKVIWGYYK